MSSRTAIEPHETWNIDDLFPDVDAFRDASSSFAQALQGIDRFRGCAVDSATALADALEAIDDLSRAFARLHTFAALRSDVDTRDAVHQEARQGIERQGTEYARAIAWLRPEILSSEASVIERFIEEEPRLEPHAHFLRDLLREREHVLGESEERLMAESGLIRRDAGSLYQILTNAELPRETIELSDGSRVTVNAVEFQARRTTRVRDDRRRLGRAYLGSYAAFRETLGLNLNAAVKSHLFMARSRHYASCLDASLAGDNVPRRVYEQLIERVRERLPLFWRYLRLRATRLEVDPLEYTDLACPLVASDGPRYTPAETREVVTEAMAPLGEEYTQGLRQAFDSRWVDWHPAQGKRSGAYATGWAYDVHPYVLLNFTGDHDSVMTTAHEMGHALHSHFSNEAQPYSTANYSIFVAEVASTFNEALVLEHLLARTTDDGERRRLLAGYLDGIRGTLFRQTMFAEFELAIHERVERGEVLTGANMDRQYLGLLREHHGHEAGVMQVDDCFGVEWAAIPHLYYDFYVYQYATGIIAASALARAVIENRAGSRERYLGFLRSGGSDYPLELLRAAGVDLERSEPYDDAFALIEEKIDQLERLG